MYAGAHNGLSGSDWIQNRIDLNDTQEMCQYTRKLENRVLCASFLELQRGKTVVRTTAGRNIRFGRPRESVWWLLG